MVTKVGNEAFCKVYEWNKDTLVQPWNFCVILGEESQMNAFNGLMIEIEKKLAEI